MGYTEKVVIGWDRLADDCRTLAEKIAADGNVPDKILAVTRGGLVIAGLVCRVLDIKVIETIGLESYHGQEQSDALLTLKKADPAFLQNSLILDDLVDTGKTYAFLREKTRNCTFACVYAKPKGRMATDYYVDDFAQTDWVEFPWESFEA